MMRISIKENPLELSLRSSSLCPKKSSRYANEKQDNPITEESSNEEKSENSERSKFKKESSRTASAGGKSYNFTQPERLPSGPQEHREDDVAVVVDDMKMLQRKSSNRKHWLLDSGRFNRVLLNN